RAHKRCDCPGRARHRLRPAALAVRHCYKTASSATYPRRFRKKLNLRVGTSGDKSLLDRVHFMLTEQIEVDVLTESILPLQERVIDKLADIMFAADMVVDMLENDPFVSAHQLKLVGPAVKRVYDDMNKLMHRLTD